MKQRLGVVLGMVAALLVAALGFAGPASAVKKAEVTATSAQTAVSKAQTKAKTVCKKTKKANKAAKNATKKAKKLKKKAKKAGTKKAKKAAKKASKKAKKLNKAKKRAKQNCNKANANTKRLIKLREASNFDVCVQGDCYRKIQEAADAAAAWQQKNKFLTTVRIQPGTYVEGVFLDGRNPALDYNGMTILGVKADKTSNPNARDVILEGDGAKTIVDGQPQVAQNAIEARNTAGLTMKNMWARNYQNNTFFVHAQTNPAPPAPATNERCADYVMENLVSSDTRSYGLFARNCFGGLIKDSEGWNHGDSAFYIGETPCDSDSWTNRGDNPGPCQANPNWTVMDNVTSHQNVLGYSGTNSKYVEIKNSTFYNNGAGIVPNTLDSEKFEPNGWMNIHDNDIFWNNYNYYSTGSAFQTVSNGLGEVLGNTVNYPIGVGIALFGSDGIVSKNNNIFGHQKWGAMSFSAPGDFGANDGDDGKNMNNQFIDNVLGRNGTDPNGVDFLNDNTGGGNCWSGNTPNPTYVLGNGSVPQSTIYPACPQPTVINKNVASFDPLAGIQADLSDPDNGSLLNPDTVLGYAAADPPQSMECSFVGDGTHPPFTDADGKTYQVAHADPVVCPE
jgi:hypothetical protein